MSNEIFKSEEYQILRDKLVDEVTEIVNNTLEAQLVEDLSCKLGLVASVMLGTLWTLCETFGEDAKSKFIALTAQFIEQRSALGVVQ